MADDRLCVTARTAFSAALDGEASATEVVTAARHLRRCLRCRRFVAGAATTTRALRATYVIRSSSVGQRG
jgi:predicted anti-sigma-YlaC factor YlaD